MSILFPTDNGLIKYYNVHYRYLLNVLQEITSVMFYTAPQLNENSFLIYVDEMSVLVDFSDHLSVSKWLDHYPICFKYHYSNDCHSQYKTMFPLGPVSFHDWKVFKVLKSQITYQCNSNLVLNNQRPGGAATERRKTVQKMLRDACGHNLDTSFYPKQEVYWKLINDCLVSVCIPGARNDMLDRGQFQYMAFGCCTISPELVTVLVGGKSLEANKHYIACKPDYSDLLEKIEWCKTHRKECVEIGKNVAVLFEQTSVPQTLWKWMAVCIRKVNSST